MGPKSFLLQPPRALSGCLFAAVVRDTRGIVLSDGDRLNHFPASPLVSVTCVIEGNIRLVPPGGGIEEVRAATPLPRVSVMPPQATPVTSWSPGPVLAIAIGVYPDGWARLAESHDIPALLERAFVDAKHVDAGWARFCTDMTPIWRSVREAGTPPDWTGAPRLADWTRALVARAALAGPGRSLRTLERRIRRWSGQTRQSLAFYAAFDDLHRLSVQKKDVPLAQLALDAGYSDQSHMGRAVRRATGFSAARLNRLIETEEAFWCYRLLGERF
ncbi:MAG: AraC family transcriptional regulator [Caldilineaceae bacterium]|nr:AraC family transcriptional regulator [Caldilineaceae bacterium]